MGGFRNLSPIVATREEKVGPEIVPKPGARSQCPVLGGNKKAGKCIEQRTGSHYSTWSVTTIGNGFRVGTRRTSRGGVGAGGTDATSKTAKQKTGAPGQLAATNEKFGSTLTS